MIELRDYQHEAVDAVREAFAEGVTRPAVVLPTGGGKTVIFSRMAQEYAAGGRRVVVLVHRDELVRQAAGTMRAVAGIDVGIVKAGEDDTCSPVIVASVQTLARAHRRERLGTDGTTVIVDECHHATAKTYRDVLTHFGCFDEDSMSTAVGFTATMDRGDGARLGDVWEKIVYRKDIPWMIRKGWLTDVRGVRLSVEDLDLSKVRMTAGDYSEGDMGEAIAASSSPKRVAESYLEHAQDLPGILFAPTVETAHLFAEAFNEAGIIATPIYGAMPLEERRQALTDYEAGRIQVLCNCMVLTEGFDSPRAQVCVIARPTTSAPLYVQMVGRVLRLFPRKQFALVIDVVGASALHTLATLASLTGSKVVPKEGQGLLEAIDEFEQDVKERADQESTYSDGPVYVQDVDLFHGSRTVWQQTDSGFWYIPAGERYIVIVPAQTPGMHDVCWYATRRNPGQSNGGWLARDIPDLVMAMSCAENDVTDEEELTALKERQWRNRKASQKTLDFARRLQIDVDNLSDRKGGTVSAAISRKLASRRMDGPIMNYLADKFS